MGLLSQVAVLHVEEAKKMLTWQFALMTLIGISLWLILLRPLSAQWASNKIVLNGKVQEASSPQVHAAGRTRRLLRAERAWAAALTRSTTDSTRLVTTV